MTNISDHPSDRHPYGCSEINDSRYRIGEDQSQTRHPGAAGEGAKRPDHRPF